MSESVNERICDVLSALEMQHGVEVLFACESGSRAWGFESVNSDWDVRFLFKHEADDYIALEEPSQQIDLMLDSGGEVLDFVGWDLLKTLRLLRRSNPSLLEWLHSPIRYLAREPFTDEVRRLMLDAFSPVASAHHYASMARSNAADVLGVEKVQLKDYFYLIRPLLALDRISVYRTIPPVRFQQLVERLVSVGSELDIEIALLLERKRNGEERSMVDSSGPIDSFLQSRMASMPDTLDRVTTDRSGGTAPNIDELNEFLRAEIRR